jgi:hypothetical protein
MNPDGRATETAALLDEARWLDGLYVGQCQPEEYEHLIRAGVMRKDYDGLGGLFGMSKLRIVRNANHD